MIGWNGWYCLDGHTYGTWLPGDPRGWREKRYRKHVAGDYRNPPPAGSGDRLHEYSHGLLKHPPVLLQAEQRQCAGRALVEMLVSEGVEVLALSLDAVHYHVLGRFADAQVRLPVGRAKKHAWFRLRERCDVRRIWQRSCNVTPITGRRHQLNVYGYVRSHAKKGAWVWTFREGLYWQQAGGGAEGDTPPDAPGGRLL